MANEPINGTATLLLINTGSPESPAYEVVGYQRDATFEESTAAIDFSSKNSRARRVGAGRYQGSVSMEALYVSGDAGYQALKTAMRDGSSILVARQEDGVVLETVDAVVETLSQGMPDQAEATVSVTLAIDGFWQEVGS